MNMDQAPEINAVVIRASEEPLLTFQAQCLQYSSWAPVNRGFLLYPDRDTCIETVDGCTINQIPRPEGCRSFIIERNALVYHGTFPRLSLNIFCSFLTGAIFCPEIQHPGRPP